MQRLGASREKCRRPDGTGWPCRFTRPYTSPDCNSCVGCGNATCKLLVNFGPHLRDGRGMLVRPGEPGYLPPSTRPYAAQTAFAPVAAAIDCIVWRCFVREQRNAYHFAPSRSLCGAAYD